MAKRPRTLEWRDGEILEAEFTEIPWHKTPRQRESAQTSKNPVKMDIQTGLAIFTVSSVVMVFSGLALFAVLFVFYALVFG